MVLTCSFAVNFFLSSITVSFSTSGVESAENPELQLEENEEDPDLDVESSYLPVAITITKVRIPIQLDN